MEGVPKVEVQNVAWQNLSYYYRVKGNAKISASQETYKNRSGIFAAALTNATGYVEKGEMVAVLGPSGSGKSTLLEILSSRLQANGLQHGPGVLVNGSSVPLSTFRSLCQLVEQDDVFLPTLYVKEALIFHANMRLGPHVDMEVKMKKIESLMASAGLLEKMSSRIGGTLNGGLSLKGLSGGEKRRLSIVCATLADPQILLLDEPTSGLDSFSALRVMETVAKFSRQGRVIMATIHQPRLQIWELFHKVAILSKGHTIYFGPTSNVINWFTDSLKVSFPQGCSVPDFVLDTVSVDFSPAIENDDDNDEEMEEQKLPTQSIKQFDVKASAKLWTQSEDSVSIERKIQECRVKSKKIEDFSIVGTGLDALVEKALQWVWKTLILLKRSATHFVRNPGNLAARAFLVIVVALFHSGVFYKVVDKMENVLDLIIVLECIFATQIELILIPFVSMSLFVEDRRFFQRESSMKLYNPLSYFIAQFTCEIILTTVLASIFSMVTYHYCLTPDDDFLPPDWVKFLTFTGITTVIANVGVAASVMAATTAPNLDVAILINCFVLTVFILLSGIFNLYPRLIKPLRAMRWISGTKYSIAATLISEFRGTKWQPTLESFGVWEPPSIWQNVCYCLIFLFVFAGISFGGLWVRSQRKLF